MTIATFDPAQTSGDELRRSYIESGYVLVTGLVDEAARAEILVNCGGSIGATTRTRPLPG